MHNPAVSVIIPTKDRPELLARCLDGLLAELRAAPPFEVIIGNDFSRYDVAGQVGVHPLAHVTPVAVVDAVQPGAAGARMGAVARASGEILGFLDDDATPQPGWFAALIAGLEVRGARDAVTGRILPYQDSLLSRSRQARYDERRRSALAQPEAPVSFLAGGNFGVRTAVFREVGGFDLRFTMMHDGEFLLRLQRSGGACYFVDEMVIRHTHVKDPLDAYVNAFRSGRFRVALSRIYPDQALRLRRELALALRGVAGRRSQDPWPIQATNSLLHLFHISGLVSSLAFERGSAGIGPRS